MEKGQPFLFDKEKGKKSDIHLSISHSGDFAVSTRRCFNYLISIKKNVLKEKKINFCYLTVQGLYPAFARVLVAFPIE